MARIGRPPGNRRTLADRLWSKVDKSGDCWLWTGGMNRATNGYGVMVVGRSEGMLYVHRLSWTLANGPIPPGMMVCHRCDVRLCVRPDHLFLGTQADNLADMHRKGRAARVDLTRRLGEANGRSVLRAEQVPIIRARHADGDTIASIARELGVGETTVRNVVKGRRWRDELPLRSRVL